MWAKKKVENSFFEKHSSTSCCGSLMLVCYLPAMNFTKIYPIWHHTLSPVMLTGISGISVDHKIWPKCSQIATRTWLLFFHVEKQEVWFSLASHPKSVRMGWLQATHVTTSLCFFFFETRKGIKRNLLAQTLFLVNTAKLQNLSFLFKAIFVTMHIIFVAPSELSLKYKLDLWMMWFSVSLVVNLMASGCGHSL